MIRKKALILSPFAPQPLDAGHRKRTFQSTQVLADLGYEITFFLYCFEDGWRHRFNEDWLDIVREQWRDVIIWRTESNVGYPAENQTHHLIDEWRDPTLVAYLEQLFRCRQFDVMVVHNVWLSYACELAPKSTTTLLETHDVFCRRRALFDAAGVEPEFFLPEEEDELEGLSRADIVLAIQDEEADWLRARLDVDVLTLPYDGEPFLAQAASPRQDYAHPDKVVFGFLGSAHRFNQMGLLPFLAALKAKVRETDAPVELRIGGQICQIVTERGPWVLDGYVDDENMFLSGVDFVVAPVFEGTGFKVKVADAIAVRRPILSGRHAAIGAELDERCLADTPDQLAEMVVDIALRRPPYPAQAKAIEQSAQAQRRAVDRGVLALKGRLRKERNLVVFDFRGLGPAQLGMALLRHSAGFHLMRRWRRQHILADIDMSDALRHLPPAVSCGRDARAVADQACLWVSIDKPAADANAPIQQRDAALAEMLGVGGGNDSAAPRPETIAYSARPDLFWHNVRWDPFLKSVKTLLASAEAPQTAADVVVVVASEIERYRRTLSLAGWDGDPLVDANAPNQIAALVHGALTGRVQSMTFSNETPTAIRRFLSGLCQALEIPSNGWLAERARDPESSEGDARIAQTEHFYLDVIGVEETPTKRTRHACATA